MAAPSNLKVIALISGGKDSLFSILHCLANGHEVVALGNLYPAQVVQDEKGHQFENELDTDSYMYQTVGHSVIKHYEDALGIALYRRALSGSAVDKSLNYSPNGTAKKGDEAEDLFLLLQDIQQKHPDANAVSTGAILSTYQRMRVESVAIRLKLTPLSFLWQYPYLSPHRDASLLEDMHTVAQDARIIKVASGGLDETFLNKLVSDPRTVARIVNKIRFYDPAVGAVLGEGGEYETLAFGGPRPLWRKKIVFASTNVLASEGGSFALHLEDSRTVEYQPEDEHGDISQLRIPPLLDAEFEYLAKEAFSPPAKSMKVSRPAGILNMGTSTGRLTNIQMPGESAEEQMRAIANVVDSKGVIATTLLLRNMSDFQAVNSIYGQIFTASLPPSRVTIATGDLLPEGCLVSFSANRFRDTIYSRSGLHVQSRSYWAPANIGPYSQAICEPLYSRSDASITSNIVHVAGQIPLVPSSMEVLTLTQIRTMDPSAEASTLTDHSVALALQHLWRIGRATNVTAWTGGIVFINAKCGPGAIEAFAHKALRQWQAIHTLSLDQQRDKEEDEIPDRGLNDITLQRPSSTDTRSPLPNAGCINSLDDIPPAYALLVADLPRGAPVEWWSMGFASKRLDWRSENMGLGVNGHTTTCRVSGTVIQWLGFERMKDVETVAELIKGEGLVLRLYATVRLPDWLADLGPLVVPCNGIWDEREQDLEAVMVAVKYGS
ncbi:adenine nucleotide alpha hydrolases-like protein [Microthyrium microscopicum]|uniref:Diphthine--ammonia ligase n=1 Tax=Microthyrium microscopicum TaxID=703497 RepID=A0A6A6U2X8_9PEZI|nr:adenine nucleotide alpha hydrolases-like protein [Microthyrium microscopicum]